MAAAFGNIGAKFLDVGPTRVRGLFHEVDRPVQIASRVVQGVIALGADLVLMPRSDRALF